jgi:lysophospholipase L1-like esterase
MKNEVIYPELQPQQMDQFNQNNYANLLLAEGDSWFAWGYLNVKPSPNVLTSMDFGKPTATISYAYSGDTVGDMVRMTAGAGFLLEMRNRRFKAMLLSGGGNDRFDAIRFGHILQPAGAGDPADPDSYVKWGAVDDLIAYVSKNYAEIISWRSHALSMNKTTPYVFHTYDWPMPRPAKAEVMGLPAVGTWLYKPLVDVGAPADLRHEIIKRVANRVLKAISDFHDPVAGIYVVDTRGSTTPALPGTAGDSKDWANEVHPNESGYAKIARLICTQLAALGVS